MDKEKLRKRALSYVTIPTGLTPLIEEYAVGEGGKGEAFFSWANEEKDSGITLRLDLDGNLTSLSIHKDDHRVHDTVPLDVDERKERAEQFLLKSYPDAFDHVTFYEMKKRDHAYRFIYEQLVMDLPLKRSSCFIDVDSYGEIIGFSYKGVDPTPKIPDVIIAKEKLMEDVQEKLDFHLVITSLLSSLQNVTESGLRLVYEIEPSFMRYKANVLNPTLTIMHDEDIPEITFALPALPNSTIGDKKVSMEDFIGIPPNMEVIRETDMGPETGIVWRDKDWENTTEDLSVCSFFKRQNDGTVKAMVSKKTGEVRSFIWFKQREGELHLSREECFQKALAFLQLQVASYYPYLQGIARDAEEDEARKIESFAFSIQTEAGVRVLSEIVIVAVDCTTGLVNHYSGPNFDLVELSQLPSRPLITKEKARDIFLRHLDFELAWDKDLDTEDALLIYRACENDARTSIRYIDARTGQVIVDK
ncbi:DUF4901 domain-containing protein [Aquibacillus koreensis]|uniref:DUF4901 domain-containing protein n=1 Tax=Aquibacillus koreensis TaxID=279446 RepID=A0A9X3WNG9_9BACI|nr:YcdB/YcdC domain-containing protein [Aquibacillus koreensis]MCT2536827.1 DUF4901 domain-containing protein [Aquibacillus koreensis]MDC3421416.1 DUF4901 domain-containing protein [Aquibacillus koreensis]